MASKTFSTLGLVLSALVFIVSLVFMILTTVRSAPKDITVTTQETVIDYTDVQTRATFDESIAQNMTSLVLSKDTVNKWGKSDGDFDSTYLINLNVQLFESSNDFSSGPMVSQPIPSSVEIDIHPVLEWTDLTEGTSEYRCTGCMMKTIEGTPTYTIPADEEATLKSTIVETLNYGALSTWYKLQNAPIYKKAWQVWAQITDKMFNQSFQSYYYAFYCFNSVDSTNTDYYNFADQTSVETMLTTLTNPFTSADATTIYTETQYGMSSYKDLTYWVNAALTARGETSESGAGTSQYTVIQDHFAEIGIDISDAQMDQIVGNGSVMLTQIGDLETRLVDNSNICGYDFLSTPIKPNPLAMTQWSQSTLLGDRLNFWLSNSDAPMQPSYTDVRSMKDLGMNFNVPPEFYPVGEIDVNQALQLSYNGATFGTYSLNFPMNMYEAWFNHAKDGVFSATTTETEAQYIVDWFTEQLTFNTEQAQGTFIAKNIESAASFLVTNFPAEAAARNVGYQINFISSPILGCTDFFTGIITDGSLSTFCETWSFADLTTLRMFVDGSMKNQMTEVATQTGLTTTQLNAFYATTSTTGTPTGTFGDVLLYINQLQSTTWVCAGASSTPVVPCTGAELAPYQWGASYYTRNPIFSGLVSSNGFLVAPSSASTSASGKSMCNWTGVDYPDCSFPPEYGAYQNQPYSYKQDYLTETQAEKIIDTDYSWYGMNNIYNGMLIFGDYEIAKKDWVSPSVYWDQTAEYYGMTNTELITLCKFLEWQSLEWLTGGVTKQYSQWDLVTGFTTDFNAKINTGSFLNGNLYVDDVVTPFLNLWMGPTANRRITMFQGEREIGADETEPYENAQFWPQDAAAVREIDNDGANIWLTQQLWTGADFEPVSWYNEKVGRTYLYDDSEPVTSACGMKVPIKNSLELTDSSFIQGFALESFSAYSQVYQFDTEKCGQPEVLGGTCYQEFTEINYKEFTEPGQLNYIDDALNMPVQISNIQSQQDIDQMQGWTTQFINIYDITLKGGARFFTSDIDDTDPVIGSINNWYHVDQEAYMNNVLPLNGTTAWATGDHVEDVTTVTPDPRKGGEKVGISALTILTFIGLVMCCIFGKLLSEGDNSAQKTAYTQGDSLVDNQL